MSDINFNATTNPALNTATGTITSWTSYTPTGDFTTNTTYTGFWRRLGDSMDVRVLITFSGAPNSIQLNEITIPVGHTIDTSKILSTGFAEENFGTVTYQDTGVSQYINGQITYNTTTAVCPLYLVSGSNTTAIPSQSAPFTFGSGDKIHLRFTVPIVEFA